MKITKRQLRRIISESITHSLLETSPVKFKDKERGKLGKKMKKAFGIGDKELNQFLDKVEERLKDGASTGGEKVVDAAKYVLNKEYRNLVGMDSQSQAMKRAKDLFGSLFEELDKTKEPHHGDEEIGMVVNQLQSIGVVAHELTDIIKQMDYVPEWGQGKITTALDRLNSLRSYMVGKGAGQIKHAAEDMGITIED